MGDKVVALEPGNYYLCPVCGVGVSEKTPIHEHLATHSEELRVFPNAIIPRERTFRVAERD